MSTETQNTQEENIGPPQAIPAQGGDLAQAAANTAIQQTTQPATTLGRFLYKHRAITQNPVGHMGYQIIRNLTAAVPYGLATAAVWEGFERFTAHANKKIQTKLGVDIAKLGNETAKVSALVAEKMPVTSALQKFARSPFRDIMMIAVGFTLYRGTLRFVRYMKEHLFNPDYSPQQADYAARHIGRTAMETVNEIAPAEINSTPYAAIALGLGRRYVNGSDDYTSRPRDYNITSQALGGKGAHPRMLRLTKDGKFHIHLSPTNPEISGGAEFLNKVVHVKSRPWTEAGIMIASFLAFFELGDRLFKDVQVRRGKWHGEHNSIARVTPEKNAIIEARRDEDAPIREHAGQHTETFGKSDPNLLRMAFTRVAPTILGIGTYTFTKRGVYAALGHFSGKDNFWKRAFVEGIATSTFFVMTTSTDLFEGMWKKLFEPKQEPQPLTSHQEQKYEALLDRVNAKESQKGRAA